MRSKRASRLSEALSPTGVLPVAPFDIETSLFQGSLALLFASVRERKVDIQGVPLGPICEAYCLYVLELSEAELEPAMVGLAALAYLLERKAWGLLPNEDQEPLAEEPTELPEATAHLYADAIEVLKTLKEQREAKHFRNIEAAGLAEIPFELEGITIDHLSATLEDLLRRATPEPLEISARPRRRLSEQMAVVLRSLSQTPRTLPQLMPEPFTKSEAVWCFLSLLELMRLGQAVAREDEGIVKFALRRARVLRQETP